MVSSVPSNSDRQGTKHTAGAGNLQNYDFYKKQIVTCFYGMSRKIFQLDVVA
jgi:hypothetical protein